MGRPRRPQPKTGGTQIPKPKLTKGRITMAALLGSMAANEVMKPETVETTMPTIEDVRAENERRVKEQLPLQRTVTQTYTVDTSTYFDQNSQDQLQLETPEWPNEYAGTFDCSPEDESDNVCADVLAAKLFPEEPDLQELFMEIIPYDVLTNLNDKDIKENANCFEEIRRRMYASTTIDPKTGKRQIATTLTTQFSDELFKSVEINMGLVDVEPYGLEWFDYNVTRQSAIEYAQEKGMEFEEDSGLDTGWDEDTAIDSGFDSEDNYEEDMDDTGIEEYEDDSGLDDTGYWE